VNDDSITVLNNMTNMILLTVLLLYYFLVLTCSTSIKQSIKA